MKYEEIAQYISQKKKFPRKASLSRIKILMEKLKNPQDELKFVHIAGTNGKGSACMFAASMLKSAGYKVGLYTSPYIYEFNERIKINGKNIEDDKLAYVMSKVNEKVLQMIEEGIEEPTEFEIITAAAFLFFKIEKCDIVVLEVGLGGNFDATNIIKSPSAVAIMSIGIDHAEILGDTEEKIALEKCGIIKENTSVICYPENGAKIQNIIKDEAYKKGASFIEVDISSLNIQSKDVSGSVFDIGELNNLEISLLGTHQVYNAVTAIYIIKELQKQGYTISDENISEGVKNAKWPARFEKVCEKPYVFVDGAHNTDGMNAFAKTVKEYCRDKRKIIVWSMMKDKDYKNCVGLLDGVCDVLITTSLNMPRAEQPDKLLEAAKELGCIKYASESVKKALDLAFSLCDDNSVILVAGSLYLANEIKMILE